MAFFFYTAILLLCYTYLFILKTIRRRSRISKLPPGPKPFPIIGNLLDLGDKPHKSLAHLAKSHGPIMSLKLGQITSIIVSSAAMAKEVLQTHDQFLSNRTTPDALYTHDHHELGLPWIPISPLWRTLRRICNNQLFSTKILDSNENLRREKVAELVAGISKSAVRGEVVDVGNEAFVTTLNLLSNTVFSLDLADTKSEMTKEFKKSVRGVMKEAGKPNLGDYFPFLKKMDFQGIRRRESLHFGKILDFFGDMINERMQMQETSGSVSNNDVLHHLLNLSSEDGDVKVGKIEFQHLLSVLFVAGTDTTSSTVQWAMAELIRNPEKLSKAQEEIRKVIGKGNPVEESDISRLPYLQAVVKETFRLHPAAPLLLPRKAQKEVEMAGFTIPKDSQIFVNAWAMGRDPSIWQNPESFEPERFLESEIDIRSRNFELIPFGGGRRICPGLPLAMRMLHLMVGSLIHFFDWKVEEEVNMDDKFGVTMEMAFPLKAIPVIF